MAVTNSHKKMAAERGRLYFMFLAPPPQSDPLMRLDLIEQICIFH